MSIHNSNTKFIARMTKATLLTLSLCLAAQCLFAQINYVRSWTITAPDLDPNAVITRPVNEARPTSNYLDGLGRPVQTVVKQGSLVTASALTGDLVSLKGFDDVARPSKQYLPYAAATIDGTYKSDALTAQPAFYNGTNSPVAGQVENGVYAYAQTNLEYSPLDRTLLTMPPGNGWLGSNKGVRTLYCGNTGVDSVPIWQVVDNGLGNFATYTTTNFYPTGSLYKTITTDENGQQVIEYKDNEGKTLLKKTELTATDNGNGSGYSGSLSTCYIYDNLNNLRCVIQPSGVAVLAGNGWVLSSNSTLLAEQCFRYEYDQRNRLIMKQVPGAGPVFMVYDVVDRLVMTQDANLRSQLKWMATLYDALNRPVITGLLSDNSSWSQLQSAVTTLTATTSVTNYTVAGQSISTVQVANNPIASSGSLDILTVTYYDNYNWTTPAGVSGSYAAPPSSGFVTSYNTAPQYAQQMTASSQTAGLVTGTLTRVLGTTNQYLSSVSFYDDYHRVIQARQTNYTGSADVLSTQYDFSGKPLRNLLQHQKGGNGPQSHTVMTKFDYDAMYREINCWKNIDGASSDQLISSMQYDALGQLSMKQLGKDLVSGSSLDNLSYTYNIRGWLAYINKDYVSQTGPGTNYFGLELGYEKATSASGSNYLNPTYNGNIAGMVWKSAGDQIERKYDFTYDNVSRLTGAAYLDNQSGWGKSVMDFTVDSLGYDANGNILSMYQHGFKLGSPTGLIDQLTYTYQPNSNKLAQVADGVNDPNSTLGDFHYSGTKQSADYSYDGNGNLTLDNNKKIDYIVYNYLNLPQQVHINGKGNILYTYDATGNKLQKQVIDSAAGIATTTLYLGGFQYQRRTPMATPSGGTDTLQFMGHEEGRARWAFHKYTTGDSAYGWEYDFMEKDHLGNTRVLLTQERDTANYIATMEDQYRTTEDALFYGIDNCVTSNPGWFPVQPGTPNPNNSIANTDGYSTHIGPSILLKVMSGDNLNIGVNALAFDGVVQPPHSSFQYVLNTLATGLVSQTGAAHGDFTSLTDPSSALYAAVGSFLSSKDTNTTSTPKAYLNWMLLDNRLNYVSGNGQSGAIPLTGLNTMQT
ncbi:DUF6443 domain-containing protein, partial [Puia sp.]|uniref:DUF6443 domain-containing protein n=1 Tax=Puia sp. TaxID=2045100 RepID=UPI002F417BB2